MHDLAVAMACTKPAGLMARYREQLQDAGIPVHVQTLPSIPHNVGNLKHKLDLYREILSGIDAHKVVISDAWDVLFFGSRDEVLAKIPDRGVICAAERNCWPDAYLADHIKGTTSWKFFNGGIAAGTRQCLLDWVDAIEQHPQYEGLMIDQQWFNFRLLQNDPIVSLDEYTKLSYCVICETGELGFDSGQPVNTLFNTRPNFIHFNSKTYNPLFDIGRQSSLMQSSRGLSADTERSGQLSCAHAV